MGPLLLGIGLIVLAIFLKRRKKARRVQEARAYFDDAKQQNSFREVTTPPGVILARGESAYLAEAAKLAETRSIRQYRGTGTRVRVARGLSVGSYQGRAESHKEWRLIDTGVACVTNRRLVFIGSKEHRSIRIIDIDAVQAFNDSIMVSTHKRARPLLICVKKPIIWAGVIQTLAAEPENLAEVNFNIVFK